MRRVTHTRVTHTTARHVTRMQAHGARVYIYIYMIYMFTHIHIGVCECVCVVRLCVLCGRNRALCLLCCARECFCAGWAGLRAECTCIHIVAHIHTHALITQNSRVYIIRTHTLNTSHSYTHLRTSRPHTRMYTHISFTHTYLHTHSHAQHTQITLTHIY